MTVEVEWLELLTIEPLLMMVVLYGCLIMIRKSLELRPSGATRGKVENTE
jgi:hypothetical protein